MLLRCYSHRLYGNSVSTRHTQQHRRQHWNRVSENLHPGRKRCFQWPVEEKVKTNRRRHVFRHVTKRRCREEWRVTHTGFKHPGGTPGGCDNASVCEQLGWEVRLEMGWRDYFRINLGTEDGEEYYFILFWEGLFWPECHGCGSYWRNVLNYCVNIYCFLLWCRCFSLFVSFPSCWGFNFGLSLFATPL